MSLKNVERQEKNIAVLEISVDKETFAAACQKAYRKNVGKIMINGFRKGKAPRHIVERIYGKDVFYEDAVEDTYPAAYEAACKEAGLDIVSRPELTIKEIGEDGYTFTAKVALKPEITVKQYKGLEAPYTEPVVTDEEVDAEIDIRRKKSSRLEDKDGEAEMGDTVIIDYEGFRDGKPFEGGKGEDHHLKLGSGSFIPGFEDQLVGKKAGEEYEIKVTFPTEYHAPDLAGKEATFKGIVHGVKKEILPELDDDFASEVSEFDTLAEYREDTRKKLLENKTKAADASFENALLGKMIETIEGDIPEAMYETEGDNLASEYSYRMQSQGITLENYLKITGLDMDGFRKSLRPQAENRVKTTLALEYVAKTEGLEVSDEDVEAEYRKMADEYGMELDRVKEMVPAEGMKHDLLMQKASALVRDAGVKTEPAPESEEAPAGEKTEEETAAE